MSNNYTCGRDQPYFEPTRQSLYLITFDIIAPVCLLLHIPGQCLLFFAFLKQLKKEEAYIYQVYHSGAETACVIFKLLYCASMQIILYVNGVKVNFFSEWLSKCYACGWYAARLSVPLYASSTILALFLSVAMASDRVLALLKPMEYNNMNHKLYRRVTLFVCISVSFALSAFDVMRSNYTWDENMKPRISFNLEYMSQAIVEILALLRVFVEAIALILLIAVSSWLCYLYHTRFVNRKVKLVGIEEQKQVKESEKTLVQLTLLSCSFTVASVSFQIGYIAMAYISPVLFNCWAFISTPIHDSGRMVIEGSGFFVTIAINKKFRQMVKSALCCWKEQNSVQPINIQGSTRGSTVQGRVNGGV